MRKKSKAVVLLSGGMDSATTLYLAKKNGFRCFCLVFDYGQRHRKEVQAARLVARAAGCRAETVKIKLPWQGSSLLDRKLSVPQAHPGRKGYRKIPTTYVPARNTIFLSFALSWAETQGAEAIFIGAHIRDYSGYPDCRPEYFAAFRRVIETGTRAGEEKKNIRIIVPLQNKSKGEIVKLGTRLKVPYELTWSCYRGGRKPCGRCAACVLRRQGFRSAGLEDPLLIKDKKP